MFGSPGDSDSFVPFPGAKPIKRGPRPSKLKLALFVATLCWPIFGGGCALMRYADYAAYPDLAILAAWAGFRWWTVAYLLSALWLVSLWFSLRRD